MAIYYVRSTDGNDADSGLTWALAKATLTGAAAASAAGDTIYVSHVHNETTAGSINPSFTGSLTAGRKVICVNDGAEPPTALATTAVVSATGSANITLAIPYGYCYGITFRAAGDFTCATSSGETFENCNFILITGSGGGSAIRFGFRNILINCGMQFFNPAQNVVFEQNCIVHGGSIISGGAAQTAWSVSVANLLVENFDFTNLDASCELFGGDQETISAKFRNCKMPASWAGGIYSATLTIGRSRVELVNCNNADTNYQLWVEDTFGTVKDEIVFVRSGGATDGTTPLSWEMVSTTSAWAFPFRALKTVDFHRWIEDVGSPITVTVEILHDSVTNLQDDEVWLEVQYLGTSGFPLGLSVDDGPSDILATPADQATSSATWTTTGMANPNKQKLSVTFTPQEKGPIYAVVHLAKSSYTLYVDPKITVS